MDGEDNYSIHFWINFGDFDYHMNLGYPTEDKARADLESLASSYLRVEGASAKGIINRRKPKKGGGYELDLVKEYRISYVEEKILLEKNNKL